MPGNSIITFAYGSNMPTARITDKTRCPSAKSVGVAELRGYELRWHKASKDGSGKADIVEIDVDGASVFGVLYEISPEEKPALDVAEGLGNGYKEVRIVVVHNGEEATVTAYQATKTNPNLKPYTWYKALAAFGAKEHGLPAAYIAQIEAVPAVEDPDRKRHDQNMRLITEVQA
jgi:cation transport regulator ChaC